MEHSEGHDVASRTDDAVSVPVNALPDVAAVAVSAGLRLHRVGMRGVAGRVMLGFADGPRLVDAMVDLSVSLVDPAARGIHMSRLYVMLDALAGHPLDGAVLSRLLHTMVASQQGMSTAASIVIRCAVMLRRPALVSGLSGWKSYPCRIEAHLDDGRVRILQSIELAYSSTCPMSAALARAANRDAFDARFGGVSSVPPDDVALWLSSEQGLAATPHAQRSLASVSLEWAADATGLPIESIVDAVEAALATPVQTAVKRADEQAFAKLNATNLMFCEDAARRVATCLLDQPGLIDFSAEVAHLESLHAHDAVAVVRRVDLGA